MSLIILARRTCCTTTPHVKDSKLHSEIDQLTIFSYIANPDAEYFRAVAATAPYHTVPALRDATWKHIAVHSSLSVKIPVCCIYGPTIVRLLYLSNDCFRFSQGNFRVFNWNFICIITV
ncbi:hypothetical protein BDV96DRAFT_147677 [Lophiotrema nucula]|uniref:Uncharacterized protein n=1 Tax=Lophiotrema nucula TaxID=690887 RepID=A0A6A5Z0J3_9PLEO|nr:hypothetical protein BDV96DRAFT_147677 [Lophiotrema nucula]